MTLDDAMATIAAVTPVATATLPPTQTPDAAATPAILARPFPVDRSSRPALRLHHPLRRHPGGHRAALRGRACPDLGIALLPASGYVPIGVQLEIPNELESMSAGGDLLPDAELVYSPTAADFDVFAFVQSAGGYLSRYSEALDDGAVLDGAAIVQRVADENSVNPRLLLGLLEHRSGWVFGSPSSADAIKHPIGFRIARPVRLVRRTHRGGRPAQPGLLRLAGRDGGRDQHRRGRHDPLEPDPQRRLGGVAASVRPADRLGPMARGRAGPAGVSGGL